MFTMLAASKMNGGRDRLHELSGIPPLSFTAKGKPLTAWSITGNTVQNGTPTPDNPVEVQAVGDRTGNLLNLNRTYSRLFTTDTTKWMNGAATMNSTGDVYAETEILGDAIKVTSKKSGYGASFLIEASPNTTYTVSFETDKVSSGSWGGISDRDINGTVISTSAVRGKSATFTTHDNCAFLNVCFRFPPADGTVTFSNIMLNEGSTALPYEPYGYKIPVVTRGKNLFDYNLMFQNSVVYNDYFNVYNLILKPYTEYEISTNGKFLQTGTQYVTQFIVCNTAEDLKTINGGVSYNKTLHKTTGADGVLRVAYRTFHDLNKTYIVKKADMDAGILWLNIIQTPITTPIYLDKPLYKIGDYADTLCYAEQKVERVVKELVLTGQENWAYEAAYTRFKLTLTDMIFLGIRTTPILCSHYITIDDGRALSNIPNNAIYVGGAVGATQILIKTDEYNTESGFKGYLAQQYAAGTPVKVYYAMQTPETKPVEPVEIPTLNGTTVIDVDTAVKPESMTIKYRR